MTAFVGFVHYISTEILILSFQVLNVNMGLVMLVTLVRTELCVERKWIWKCFPTGTSASVEKAFQVHTVRSMSMNAVPVLAWMDIAMTVSSLSHSNSCRAVRLRIWHSNDITQDISMIIYCLYLALNVKVSANYFHKISPPLTNSFIFLWVITVANEKKINEMWLFSPYYFNDRFF